MLRKTINGREQASTFEFEKTESCRVEETRGAKEAKKRRCV